ncbi:TRM11 family SAM-dependent methyltransferase [Clostridium fungisolvens]|uniref:Methyltransferase n=1 Tax=Clostridium fungisolvens TaxID=1604897 RepID=A0A6V8SIP0_9CLOT|nr:DNA methyltransferase [Clostridium fungisolvens]GFP76385.1 hypothetical protein bsdtw1_02487 [Clostridium fungisolvens]
MSEVERKLQGTSLWSFPNRGHWSAHRGDYPGNWSPYVPRNIILRYSNDGDLVLDQFLGSGTTAIEAAMLNRRFIGTDVNDYALKISKERCYKYNGFNISIERGDARNLVAINDNSIDLICTHPPYANIIKYSDDEKDDLSLLTVEDFYKSMKLVAKECFRVLKNNCYCAILMGDTRKNGFIVPLGFNIMNIFMNEGFLLKEIVIKEQHNCKSADKWKEISKKKNFLLIAHEYLFVLKKF